MDKSNEAMLVLKAQSGDRQALDELFSHVQAPLYRCIRHIAVHRQLSEDILQDVFVILCRKLIWLREPVHFRSWAYRIASREAIRRIQRERRSTVSSLEPHNHPTVDPEPPVALSASAP